MHNLVLFDFFIILVFLTALRAAYYTFKLFKLTKKLSLKMGLRPTLAKKTEVKNVVLQVDPEFSISSITKDKAASQDLPSNLAIGNEPALAAHNEKDFVMPITSQDWKIYDEPTYLRRGLFLS